MISKDLDQIEMRLIRVVARMITESLRFNEGMTIEKEAEARVTKEVVDLQQLQEMKVQTTEERIRKEKRKKSKRVVK